MNTMKSLFRKLSGKSSRHLAGRERRLSFESVEERRLMTAARSPAPKSEPDPVMALAQADAQDGSISRADMLGLFAEVEADGRVTCARAQRFNRHL